MSRNIGDVLDLAAYAALCNGPPSADPHTLVAEMLRDVMGGAARAQPIETR